jgi:branched-chain amino acid transport system substrate-binding protein
MLKRILVILAVVFVALSTSIFAQEEADGEPIPVGAIFDLSGATGDVGTPYAEGVISYIDWLNSNGGINGRPIELISQDYAYSVETAESLYSQFVEEGVVVFMGWGTGDTLALVGRITEDEIPFISASYSASLNDPQGEAPYNFLIATTYSDQLILMMQHMLDGWTAEGNDASDMRVAVFHNDSPFGTDPIADGQEWADEAGIGADNVLAVAMPRGTTSFNAEIQQADDFGVTHIVVQNVSSPAALLAQNLEDFGLMDFIEFGCLNWCADELFVELAGDAADGTLGAIPFTPTTVEVPGQEAPREYLGGQEALEEATLHFTQGWAAMDVMAEAIERTLNNDMELTGPNIRDTMQQMEDYETGGLMPPVTFTAEDHRANRALAIYEVEDGIWVQASEVMDLRASDEDMMEEEATEEASED